MQKNDIDAYLLQETWDEKDYISERVDGYTAFHHNDDRKQIRTRVTIMLSPRYSNDWKAAGGLDPIQTPRGKFEGRFVGITLQFPLFNERGNAIKNKWNKLGIATVYHPYGDTYV